MHVLVINSGSSSIKFHLYDMEQENLLVSGKLESIGESIGHSVYLDYKTNGEIIEHKEDSAIVDHTTGLKHVFAFLQQRFSMGTMKPLQAIGHRVVHGGETFQTPTLINADVMTSIREMIPLAPLHNPANLAGIEAAQHLFPHLPQVAIFDTAFFRSLPPYAYHYALPKAFYTQHHIRRYGFHGISHQHVAKQAADYLQQDLANLKVITLHLGNGASAAAIHKGICIDTSMGMTPLEGLVMGTRCGDIDPAVHFYFARSLGMSVDEIEALLNHDSGLKGLSGVTDMREIHRLVAQGDVQAALAIDMFCYRIAKYIGAYYVALGGLDALIFTARIGENDAIIRQAICSRLTVLGIDLDLERNQRGDGGTVDLSKDNSKVTILVTPSDEELEIARQTLLVINETS